MIISPAPNPKPKPHQLLAPILAAEVVAPQHFLFSLHAPAIAIQAQAGQFLHVLPRDNFSYDPFLRRAFSILDARPESGEIDILFRAGGKGTTRLSKSTIGEYLDVIGPLGRPFDLSLFHVKHDEGQQNLKPILVGGGVGVPPLVFLAKSFVKAGISPVAVIGARRGVEVLGVQRLEEWGIETRVCTEDGSAGQMGRVTGPLEVELQKSANPQGRSQGQPQVVIYACGPLPMLRAVADLAKRFGVPCQVSMEENMPCGIGVCNGCVVAMKTGETGTRGVMTDSSSGSEREDERYQRICVTGPAVWADRVEWEAI